MIYLGHGRVDIKGIYLLLRLNVWGLFPRKMWKRQHFKILRFILLVVINPFY